MMLKKKSIHLLPYLFIFTLPKSIYSFSTITTKTTKTTRTTAFTKFTNNYYYHIANTKQQYEQPQQCRAVSASATVLNAYPPRPNVSMLTDESFNDEDDDHVGVWTNPQMDKEKRDQLELERGKKTRKELIEDILRKDDYEWQKEKVQSIREEKKKMIKLNEKRENEDTTTAKLAEKVGVTLTMLEPRDDFDTDPIELSVSESKKGWFNEFEKELDREEEEDYEPSVVDGELVDARQKIAKKKGILVGSAGGWSLEVFPGDFVVHRKYGIGRFERTTLKPKTKLTEEEKAAQTKRRQALIQKLRETFPPDLSEVIQRQKLDNLAAAFGTDDDTDPISNPQISVLEISYKDAIVHVPVERAYRLSRYRAGDAVIKPRLNRVKGESWRKAKGKVMSSTAQLAEDVLALYATRETLQRTPFSPLLEGEVKTFENTFPYDPTPDQTLCFEAVENDMVWRKRPMDRLICGDVGFGKTEVALRALHRCVVNKRQAALLAPTGVLSAQHYKNICSRMEQFGVKVGLLRGGMGKNTKAGRELRERIRTKDVDIIVGTHALLSNQLEFNDLGLLVVDEEQRFGVKQKERLKLICNGIDVLTLSATPIPRTLQMSLSGIRDTSTIRSPPPMRKPTCTVVDEFNEQIVKQAIQTELDRGGQCYYVVPRIAMLEDAAKLIRDLFPGVELVMAHGRMPRQGAEENVSRFAEGKGMVLLATTVIENGVDIPSVNTIIVQDAQAFGMSTLYQLRGRVGRSNIQAHAYFLHKEQLATEQSTARLQAMADLHQLGSGFDVANRDLEIRGAGSLLGTEQSGMAARVGFDLYMRMLKKSIRQLRRLDLPTVPRTNIILPYGEGSIEGKKSFSIPENFIIDDAERLKQEGTARLAENTSALVDLTGQWKDVHGALPTKLQAQLKALHLHVCTRQLGIDLVGLVRSETSDSKDLILRAPGLRARHLARICSDLPRKTIPKGLDAVFPARFSSSKSDMEIKGGAKVDWAGILKEDEDDDDEWDTEDEDEVEAIKTITSAMSIVNMDEVDEEEFPRFVIHNFGSIKRGSRVDATLKVLLPVVKIVAQKQEEDKEKAKVAAQLREKRETIKKERKTAIEKERLRSGYYY